MKKYKKECQGKGGILFCVFRAKFSEGFNFTDDLCRGIILVGVPNLNIKDPKVIMKYLYFLEQENV